MEMESGLDQREIGTAWQKSWCDAMEENGNKVKINRRKGRRRGKKKAMVNAAEKNRREKNRNDST